MTPVSAILRAVMRSMRRDLGSFFAIKVNNFFLFVLLLIWGNLVSGLPPRSAYPFLLLFGFLLLFPLSSDPLAKIPAVRGAIWPLAAPQRALLRFAGVALSPALWIACLLLLVRTSIEVALAFLGLAVVMQLTLALLPPAIRARTLPLR